VLTNQSIANMAGFVWERGPVTRFSCSSWLLHAVVALLTVPFLVAFAGSLTEYRILGEMAKELKPEARRVLPCRLSLHAVCEPRHIIATFRTLQRFA
jgi:hypothetical protein